MSAESGSDPILEDLCRLKARLLTEGCARDPALELPRDAHPKKIHLYAHSPTEATEPLPDDLVLGGPQGPVVARLRYDREAALELRAGDQGHEVRDRQSGAAWPVHFLPAARFIDEPCGQTSVGAVCAMLGADVLGVIPSNHCFYFRAGTECRFCEIQQTHRQSVEYRPTAKRRDIITEAVATAFTLEPRLRHFAVTSGNVRDYDYTARMFADLGARTAEVVDRRSLGDQLATLMPPTDLGLIDAIRRSGFNKIYFPLEVFRRDLFKVMCPGKDEYGYDRMLDALAMAVEVFGKGNAYTNFIYGVQSLDSPIGGRGFDPVRENEVALEATADLLDRGVIPAFTIYHYGGANVIGELPLSSRRTLEFFREWGRMVAASGLVPPARDAVLFGSRSLSNTLFNDAFLLAKRA